MKRLLAAAQKEERPSFLQKRSKKLLFRSLVSTHSIFTAAPRLLRRANGAKVFWSFLAKKDCLLSIRYPQPRSIRAAALLATLWLAPLAAIAAEPEPLTVFAAASLTNALQDIGNLWTAAGHGRVVFSFAASSTLAQQIERGAPAAVFISADEKWMDDLARHHGIVPTTREDLVGNSLVLVEPAGMLQPISLVQGASLDAVLGPTGRLAVGDPSHVPAGIYAQQALQKLGMWPSLQNRLAPADSVRSALRLVEVREAPAGIVYATDVKTTPTLAVAGTFPAASHDPIRYPAAVVADTPAARAFLAFLSTQQAQDVFEHYGFTRP